jgi:hypothetical protein
MKEHERARVAVRSRQMVNHVGATGAGLATVFVVAMLSSANVFGQQPPGPRDQQVAAERVQHQRRLQQVVDDKVGFAAALVAKWETTARMSGKWNATYATDLQGALMKLAPEDLLAASDATSEKAMMEIIATGRREPALLPAQVSDKGTAERLGDGFGDLVYTPVTPCRIADTRVAGGLIAGNSTRTFDLDGTDLTAQGGSSTGCGIPFGAATAAALTITVTGPQGGGFLTAWGLGTQPFSAALTYAAGETTSNMTIVPDVPGGGNDFSLYAYSSTHAVVDVVGYFAAPVATPLDCTMVSSALTAVPVNVWTGVDAFCPVGRTATGGGTFANEGTLGFPGVWTTTIPGAAYGFNGWRTLVDNQTNGARNIQTFATCCRVPGR